MTLIMRDCRRSQSHYEVRLDAAGKTRFRGDKGKRKKNNRPIDSFDGKSLISRSWNFVCVYVCTSTFIANFKFDSAETRKNV